MIPFHLVLGLLGFLGQSPLGAQGREANSKAVTERALPQGELRGHQDGVFWIAFSSDGHRLASAGRDRTVKVWDTQSGAELVTFKGHGNQVLRVTFDRENGQVASAAADFLVKIWDAGTGKEAICLDGHKNWVAGVAFSADSR